MVAGARSSHSPTDTAATGRDGPDTTGPSAICVARVQAGGRHRSTDQALAHIATLAAAQLICLDCGSENHTRGNRFCPQHDPLTPPADAHDGDAAPHRGTDI